VRESQPGDDGHSRGILPVQSLRIETPKVTAKQTPAIADQIPVPVELIERRIYLIRGQKVMLDSDLAELYQVPTKRLNEAVKRNFDRFPEDFMFQLTDQETDSLRSQFATSNVGRGGRRYPPYAFTELGVAMLSSVLNSERAVQMNILIMRAFVKLRELLATHKDLARKIEKLEATQEDHAVMLALVVKDIQTLATTVKKEFRKLKEPRRRKPSIGFNVD
jgi:ORF6N domain